MKAGVHRIGFLRLEDGELVFKVVDGNAVMSPVEVDRRRAAQRRATSAVPSVDSSSTTTTRMGEPSLRVRRG